MDISQILDVSKYDPANKKLSAFINKKIKIMTFKSAKSLSKDKEGNPKPAVTIKFLDEDGNKFEYITAASLLVKQLYDMQNSSGFGTPNSLVVVDGIDCYLRAEKSFGRYRNFYLSNEPDSKVSTKDEDNLEEAVIPTPNVKLNDNDIDDIGDDD